MNGINEVIIGDKYLVASDKPITAEGPEGARTGVRIKAGTLLVKFDTKSLVVKNEHTRITRLRMPITGTNLVGYQNNLGDVVLSCPDGETFYIGTDPKQYFQR